MPKLTRRWLLPAIAAVWTAACTSKPGQYAGPVKDPDTYTYLTISDVDSLDPAYAYDTASHLLILNLYEPLVAYDGPSTEKLVALLAAQVPTAENGLISGDGRAYTFPIRRGVRFQDGSEMTPEDVKYSILRFMLQDRDSGPSSLLLEPLLGYPATRENGKIKPSAFRDADRAVQVKGGSVILKLPSANASILSILATWSPIVSKKWAAAHGDWDGSEETWQKHNNPNKENSYLFDHANGTGAFYLERWDKNNKMLILARNENYWRAPARLKRVVIKGVDEFATRKLKLQVGDADGIYADFSVRGQVESIPGVEIIDNLPTVEMNPIVYFTFDINPSANKDIGSGRLDGRGIPANFFQDKDVRKGFAYAMDYGAFIRDVFRGQATQATGGIPKSLPGNNPGQKTYTHDLDKAAGHFRKAWGGAVWDKGFKLTLLFNSGNVPRQTMSQILKRNIELINPKFKLDIRGVQWSNFLDGAKNHKFPMFVLGWNADYPDPHNFAFPLYHSKGNYPAMQRFKNGEMDRLVEAGLKETDLHKRKKIYYRLQALAAEEAPNIVLVDTVKYRTQRRWVRGWYHNPIFPDSPYGSYFYPIYKE